MIQTLAAYLLTAAAFAWVVWSVLLPKSVKRALKPRLAKTAAVAGPGKGCGDGCSCGD
ncbi:MAG TPA: hypothetical protein VL460_06625 [Caulobacteraceae bacterium]|jgi:hypothetical protein|nr:hypothetical protein [Caulobacteraceae bacterium]